MNAISFLGFKMINMVSCRGYVCFIVWFKHNVTENTIWIDIVFRTGVFIMKTNMQENVKNSPIKSGVEPESFALSRFAYNNTSMNETKKTKCWNIEIFFA